MKKILAIIILIVISIPTLSYSTDAIIEEQLENLNIGSFVTEGKKYTKEAFPELDVKELITQSLTRRSK